MPCIGRRESPRHALELGGVPIRELARGNSFLARRLEHLDAVLVRAGHEEDVPAIVAMETGDRIRRDQLVGMPDVRLAVGIGNGGRQIEFLA